MTRGRKRTPTGMLELRGSRHAAGRGDEPRPVPGNVTCPSWLSAAAKAEWKRLFPELRRLGLITLVDRASFAAYCEAVGELQEATILLERDGRVIDVPIVSRNRKTGEETVLGTKKTVHPAFRLQQQAFGNVKKFL